MTNREYDEARDRSDMVFHLIPREGDKGEEIRRDLKLFKDPQRFHCPACGKPNQFRLLVDGAPGDSNIVMIGCMCGIWMRAVELRVPQMNDERAKQLGLYVPRSPGVEFEIELEF